MFDRILDDLLKSVPGAKATIFLDTEGESIAHAGDPSIDIRLVGAWKEIHLDQIREISKRLGMGAVHAVLFSLDEGNELIVPITTDYCLLLFLSPLADVRSAITGVKQAVELLKKEVE